MKKDKILEANNQNTGEGNVSLLPYTTPELSVYNQAKITMGGVVLKAQDFTGPGTSYRSS